MRIYSGVLDRLPPGLSGQLAAYRYSVFVKLLGWELETPEGIEQDQFDRPDTVYVIAVSDKGNVIGCARLLPTEKPYLLGEVFPALLNGLEPPASPEVWELSRFAAVDLGSPTRPPSGQLSSPIAVELLRQAVACAERLGAKRVVTVSPVGVERLLKKCGLVSHRAGPPTIVDGYALCACWIDTESADVSESASGITTFSSGPHSAEFWS